MKLKIIIPLILTGIFFIILILLGTIDMFVDTTLVERALA